MLAHNFIGWRGKSAYTIRHRHRSTSECIVHCIDNGEIGEDPAVLVISKLLPELEEWRWQIYFSFSEAGFSKPGKAYKKFMLEYNHQIEQVTKHKTLLLK